jgi:hypothetical protein
VFDEQEQRWVSDAQVAQIHFTAFTSYPQDQQIPCRLVVRRVQRLNKTAAAQGQGELFDTWRHHAFVTNSTLSVVDADETHRDHAIIEQVIAELKSGPLAHAPLRIVRREQRLVGPGLHRVQHPARRRLRRIRPARQSQMGHPTHPPGHRPRPSRVHRPTTRAPPPKGLALGTGLRRPLGHRHHLTTPAEPAPTRNPRRGRAGQTGRSPTPETSQPFARPRDRPLNPSKISVGGFSMTLSSGLGQLLPSWRGDFEGAVVA